MVVEMAPSDELVDVFYCMQVQHAHLVQLIAVRHDLNPVDVRTIKMLGARAEPPTVKQIGEYLQMGTGAMTALVDRLERRGLVERLRNPADRRSVLVKLQPSGAAVVAEIRDAYRRGLVAAIATAEQGSFAARVGSVATEFRRIADEL